MMSAMRGLGSAPHMRGIRHSPYLPGSPPGISPAHAGNTDAAEADTALDEDQPRTCGEYGPQPAAALALAGSAPHMRGIQGPVRKQSQAAGISPAHAGNTSLPPNCPPPTPDQPRTCGEYFVSHLSLLVFGGSAPHMRGIQGGSCMCTRPVRISPAHAGNTRCRP